MYLSSFSIYETYPAIVNVEWCQSYEITYIALNGAQVLIQNVLIWNESKGSEDYKVKHKK